MFRASHDIRKAMEVPQTFHQAMEPTDFGTYEISIHTDIGGRKNQEDRFTFCPRVIPGHEDTAFFGVFDGTVGDFASENVKDLVVPQLVGCPAWKRTCDIVIDAEKRGSADQLQDTDIPTCLATCISHMYQHADKELVHMCEAYKKDYASSTAVAAVLIKDIVAVGHLGDSRIVLGSQSDNANFDARFLTVDHKPDMPEEKMRILRNGGSVEYLHNHNNKPFIRGGDFAYRKSRGEQPMQLQYSRAFGGKDLKMFGLSNDPSLTVLKLKKSDKVLILATDGLWDVLTGPQAVSVAMHAKKQGRNPARELVNVALGEQQSRNQSADNITSMVVIFK